MSFYLIFKTPFGEAAIVFRREPFALIEIGLPRGKQEALLAAFKKPGRSQSGSHEKAVALAESINAYFKGKPLQPPWHWMDMGGLTPLQRAVLTATADIPYGELRSYREVAEAVDRPRAYRSVGSALAKNPFPLLIPCHRVIRSDGSYGCFGGGTDLKKRLIELEAKQAV